MIDRIAVGIALTTEPEATRSLLHGFCHELAVATGLPVVAHGMWRYHHLVGHWLLCIFFCILNLRAY